MKTLELDPLFSDSFQNSSPLVIAGPCSAETRGQTILTASLLRDAGISLFRAGVWKPRTKPGGFEGMGNIALSWLAEVRRATGMIPLTEIATPSHLRDALDAGIDAFWIGARTSANPFAVQLIADQLAALPPCRRDDVTVLVKNPVNPDLELWIGAIERIRNAGVRRIGAVHRGFSSYMPGLFRNIPEWRIPIELRRRIPELPLICDPSHIGGRRELVAPLAQQALDMNFDGLMIESHCCPDTALSDAAQQITPGVLAGILESLSYRRTMVAAETISDLRSRIDCIDAQLVELLARRMEVSDEIGRFKRRHGMAVVQPERYSRLMEKRVGQGVSLGMSPGFMRSIFSAVHEESVRRQIP